MPCHNDLLAANVLDDGGDLRIIDYEYSGMNEPSFELGDAIAEAGLGEDALVELCAAYYGGTTTPSSRGPSSGGGWRATAGRCGG